MFAPVGKGTVVEISYPWNIPSFSGQYLPESRDVAKDGFKAKWNVLHLNRNYPQQWKGNSHNIYHSTFGVNC